MQFADQRVARRFAGFELSSGKLLVAGVGLALGALGEQHLSIGTKDHRGGDANDGH